MVRARVPRTATRERGTPVAGRGRRQDAGSEGGKAIRKKAEGRTAFPGELPPFCLLPSTFYLLPCQYSEVSPEKLQHGQRGDRDRVGAQRAVAERDEARAMRARERAFFGRPAAFGTDQHGGIGRHGAIAQ